MSNVIQLFREYMGTGLIVGWFLVSMGYLLLTEKRKHLRILFVYVPIILLLFYFNPLFANVIYGIIGNEIYYRIIWLIPITTVIAYAMIQIYEKAKGKLKICFVVIGSFLIVISGTYVYNNIYYTKADNIYHIPQEVVEICDSIKVEGREVMAVFPIEMLQYVRQYSPVICMPYGRDIVVTKWKVTHELFDAMEAPVIDAKAVAELAKADGCHYVILSSEKEIKGTLLDYDYELFDTVGDYLVYYDTTMYKGLFD